MKVVVVMVEFIRPEQWLSLVLSGKRLLDEENHLLYEEYQEEPTTNDKFGDGKVDSDPVLCLNLLKYLNQTWLGLKYSSAVLTSSNSSSVSGIRSRKQAAMNTPPEKQEQRLMKTSHLLLEPW